MEYQTPKTWQQANEAWGCNGCKSGTCCEYEDLDGLGESCIYGETCSISCKECGESVVFWGSWPFKEDETHPHTLDMKESLAGIGFVTFKNNRRGLREGYVPFTFSCPHCNKETGLPDYMIKSATKHTKKEVRND